MQLKHPRQIRTTSPQIDTNPSSTFPQTYRTSENFRKSTRKGSETRKNSCPVSTSIVLIPEPEIDNPVTLSRLDGIKIEASDEHPSNA
jgi:hypothetical protein